MRRSCQYLNRNRMERNESSLQELMIMPNRTSQRRRESSMITLMKSLKKK